ncbi:MAG: hypothetical protein ACLFWM_07520 [Actinomycetota bacterium]
MTTNADPHPGTVAGAQPPPAAVTDALRLASEDVAIPAAVEQLTATYTAGDLRAAQLWWVRRMHRASWKDRRSRVVLRMLERALAEVDGLAGRPGVR